MYVRPDLGSSEKHYCKLVVHRTPPSLPHRHSLPSSPPPLAYLHRTLSLLLHFQHRCRKNTSSRDVLNMKMHIMPQAEVAIIILQHDPKEQAGTKYHTKEELETHILNTSRNRSPSARKETANACLRSIRGLRIRWRAPVCPSTVPDPCRV